MTEFDRLVQLRVRLADVDGRGFGSGHLVAPRLVLTAAHVLDGMAGSGADAVTVSRPDAGGREFPATVVWSRKDAVVDAALVEITDTDDELRWPVPESMGNLHARPPQRFGLLIGTRPHPVTLVGFPRMQKDPDDGRRLDEQVTGRIPPGTGALADRYEILANDPTPHTNAGNAWSGISGSAVLADDDPGQDFLVGVVRYDHHADGGTRLSATRAAHLVADSGFRALITAHTGWEPVLEPVEPAGVLASAVPGRDLASPAALLRADAEAVTFHGRTRELALLRAWCVTDPATVSVRALTGPGGQGKTRLARRLADDVGRQGWVIGHLRSDLTDHDIAPPNFATLATALPLLVVVDYAETRPLLLRGLISTLLGSRHRVRLLLLARSDGPWRTDGLSARNAVRTLLETPVIALAPLNPRDGTTEAAPGHSANPSEERAEAFAAAARDLAAFLPRVPTTVPGHDWKALAATLRPPGDLADPRYENALTLQMAALAALLQHGPAPAETAPGAPPEEILLAHEHRFWADSATSPAFKLGDLSTSELGAAVAAAALCGAAGRDEATAVLGTLPGLPADKVHRTSAWVKELYPAEPGRYWGSLQPDRIAEYHASRALTDGALTVTDLLGVATSGQQAQLVTVLVRAAIAHYNAGRTPHSEHLLRVLDTDLVVDALDHQALRTANAMPSSSPTAALAVRLAEALVRVGSKRDPHDAAHDPEHAAALSLFAIRLSEVGRSRDAAAVAQRAVATHRRPAAEDPAAHEPGLAGALSDLGTRSAELGQWERALAFEREAVEIWRRHRSTHELGLAGSLSNLGIRLSDLNQPEDALTAEEEAVEIFRRWTEKSAAHEAALALSLSNLAKRLWNVGKLPEAVTATEEAVRIYRRLAAENPAVHEAHLARVLSNFGAQSAQMGCSDEASVAFAQAVETRRRLLALRGDPVSRRALAISLANLGTHLWILGLGYQALPFLAEAEELLRGCMVELPSVREQLHRVASARAAVLDQLGRGIEAEAVRRRLRNDPPPPDTGG